MSDVKRKKFTETAVGKWLDKAKDVVPGIVDVVTGGRFSGAIDVVEKLLKKEEDNPVARELLHELELRRIDFESELLEHEQALEAIYAGDRADARNREIETLKAGENNWLQKVLALIIVAGFLALVFVLLTGKSKEIAPPLESVLLVLIGTLAGNVNTIYQYFFGSSSGSAFKNTLFKQSNKQP